MSSKVKKAATFQPATRLVTGGHDYCEHGIVNPPVYHASTVLFPDLETYETKNQPYTYGRRGTPTSKALEDAVATLEQGYATCLYPSGLSAIFGTFMGLLKTGDHILMTDSVYSPTRACCDTTLPNLGITTSYYDPLIGTGIEALITPETKLIFTESPGSQTMEMQDIPAICQIADKYDIPVAIDNTWAAGYLFNAFDAGCSVSIQAATKYIVGHSDVMMGTATATERYYDMLLKAHGSMGLCVGPDDTYLALRGLRSMDARLERHMRSALQVAQWLKTQSDVVDVLYPALPGAPGHEIWKRDFTGASGLFTVLLKPCSKKALAALIDDMALFGLGVSWGGYESLILPFDPTSYRTATKWSHNGPAIRLHIGLESTDDLIADLKAGLERMNAAG